MRELSELQALILETSSLLCGFVSQQLRAIKVALDEGSKTIYLCGYWDGEIAESEDDNLNLVAQLLAEHLRFDSSYKVVKSVHRIDYPMQLPADGHFVYLRDESIFDEKKVILPQFDDRFYLNNECGEADNLNLSAIFALLGKVRPNLRYFWVDIDELNRVAYFSFYFDGEILEQDTKLAQDVVDKAMVRLSDGYSAKLSIERTDFPQPIPRMGIAIYERDESALHDEDKTYQEYSEKEWINIETQTSVVYKKQVVSPNSLLSRIRSALIGKIRANVRAIQVSINQIKRLATLWFHYAGEISDGNAELVALVKKAVIRARYNVEVFEECLDLPETIPDLGYCIFKRDESPLGTIQGVEDENTARCTELNEYVSKQVAALWPASPHKRLPYLRAIKMAASNFEKTLFLFFVFNKS
ncbi:MAG: hypothetical protein JSS12_09210, partial [Verrucomicrobia bacterium]|nr:hypothetical protein [Verrucomicrobiota bacterium]